MPEKDSFVRITYTGRIRETGELFDTTDIDIAKSESAYNSQMRYGPVTIVLGEGRLLKGLDEAVQSMKVGEERIVDVPSEKAFGVRSTQMVKLIPLQEFRRQGFDPQAGMAISLNNIRGRVLSANSGRVRVDFNHPLAGKALTYKVKLEEQIGDKTKQARGLADFYLSENVDIKIVNDVCEIEHKDEIAQKTKEALTDDLKKFVGVSSVKFGQTVRGSSPKSA